VASLAPLAVAGPLLVAAVLVAASPLRRTPVDLIAVATASAATLFCGAILVEALADEGPLVNQLGGWEPGPGGAVLGITMAIDPLGAGLATLAAALVTAALLFTWRFFDAPARLFHALMLAFLAGLAGFALTGDLFNMFVFFELMSVSAYALTAYRIERPEPLQGALGFAVSNSVGAMMILFGIGLLYGRTGALNLAQVGEALAGRPADALVVVAFAAIVGGFLVKAAAVPFHFWLADAYAVAPTPAAIVFTGVMSDLGVYAVARLYWTVFEGTLDPHAEAVRAVLVGFATLTALVGAVMCLFQVHLKRLLAFATISQIGLALLGVALLTPAGIAGAALLVPADGLLRAGLFVCLGILLHRCRSINELRLRGRGSQVPWLVAALFVAGALGLAALPPLGAFAGKSVIEDAASEVGYDWVIVVLVVATVLTCAALLRAAGRIFLGRGVGAPPGQVEESELAGTAGYTPVVVLASATVLVVAGLLLGTVPGIVDGASEAATRFTDRPLYAATVLETALPAPGEAETLHIGGLAIGLGVLTALGSIALAAFLLRNLRPFAYPAGRWSVFAGALRRLRRLHSGQVGDYVAWLIVGFALLGGSLAAAIHP
jgi:multicomponent Na+:H+ antiporter subunit D